MIDAASGTKLPIVRTYASRAKTWGIILYFGRNMFDDDTLRKTVA